MRKLKKRKLGTTLAEVMFAAFFVTFIFGNLAWGMMEVSRVTSQESTASSFSAQSRTALDSMRQDAVSSSSALSTLTVNSTTYTSNPAGVLILQEPTVTYDGSGNVSTTYQDNVIYHLVGASAPYTLNKLISPQTGSPRPRQPDTVVVNNVKTLAITFLHHVAWTGNGSATTFALDVPAAGTASASNSTVNSGGTTISFGSGATFVAVNGTYPNGAISLTTAPANNTKVDAFYPVDSTTAAGSAGVSSVNLDLTMSATQVVPGAPATQSMETMSTAQLRNH